MKAKNIEGFKNILDQAESNALTNWEMAFVAGIRTKYSRQGEELELTENQVERLETLSNL